MTGLRSPFDPDFSPNDAANLAATLKALIDPTRLRILSLLAAKGTLVGRELEGMLGVGQPVLSHHLRILDDAGLIRSHKLGVYVMRTLDPKGLAALMDLIRPAVTE